jgi:hypothetical protein
VRTQRRDTATLPPRTLDTATKAKITARISRQAIPPVHDADCRAQALAVVFPHTLPPHRPQRGKEGAAHDPNLRGTP